MSQVLQHYKNESTFNPYLKADINEQIDARIEQKLQERGTRVFWHRPSDNSSYIARDPTATLDDAKDDPEAVYGIKVMDYTKYHKGKRLKEKYGDTLSGTEVDVSEIQPFEPEFQDLAVRYRDMLRNWKNGKIKTAGVITSAEYSALADPVVTGELLDLTNREFTLEQAVTRQNVDTKTITIDSITGYQASEDIGENDVVDTQNIGYTSQTISLKKHQIHIAWSGWANMTNRRRDVVADTQRYLDADWPRLYANNILNTLTGFSDTASTGGSWSVIAGGAFHSTANPKTSINARATAIRAAGGRADTLVMNSKTYDAMAQNTFMRQAGIFNTGSPVSADGYTPRAVTHPLLIGFQIYIDELVTTGDVFIYDRRTVLGLYGPTRTVSYYDERPNLRGQLVDRWFNSAIRTSTLGAQLTGAET